MVFLSLLFPLFFFIRRLWFQQRKNKGKKFLRFVQKQLSARSAVGKAHLQFVTGRQVMLVLIIFRWQRRQKTALRIKHYTHIIFIDILRIFSSDTRRQTHTRVAQQRSETITKQNKNTATNNKIKAFWKEHIECGASNFDWKTKVAKKNVWMTWLITLLLLFRSAE